MLLYSRHYRAERRAFGALERPFRALRDCVRKYMLVPACTLFLRPLLEALYEDVWFKYAWHCRDDKEKSLRILKKAAEIHLPRRPAVSLALAAFHEGKNDLSSTRSVYESILKQGFLSVMVIIMDMLIIIFVSPCARGDSHSFCQL
jgi:hypothetical protein